MTTRAGPQRSAKNEPVKPKNGSAWMAPGASGLIVPPDYPEGAIKLLQSWREGSDEERREQQETWEFLKRALDEDRPSYRKLFP